MFGRRSTSSPQTDCSPEVERGWGGWQQVSISMVWRLDRQTDRQTDTDWLATHPGQHVSLVECEGLSLLELDTLLVQQLHGKPSGRKGGGGGGGGGT